MTQRVALVYALVAAILVLVPAASNADERTAGVRARLFSIRKSENRNRVEYVTAVDVGCGLRGSAPVSAFWQMIEDGPTAREPLTAMERRVYGIARQVVGADGSGGRVDVVIRALRTRAIVVRASRVDGRCTARASTTIGGALATIDDVLVVQRGPLSIDHVELRGRSLADGSPRFESIAP